MDTDMGTLVYFVFGFTLTRILNLFLSSIAAGLLLPPALLV